MRTLLRHPRRVWQVIGVFGRYYVLPRLPFRRLRSQPGPVRMRLALEELGGAWIKLGQMLAMRFDLLPAAYCDELFKLLNQVRPFPYAQVAEIVRQELGGPPEVVFQTFETESFAAASIGQVHRAVLHSGESVAVKIQRPGIRESLQADIDLMYAMGRLRRLDPPLRGDPKPDRHRRVRAVDRRRARLPRRGTPGRAPLRPRSGRDP